MARVSGSYSEIPVLTSDEILVVETLHCPTQASENSSKADGRRRTLSRAALPWLLPAAAPRGLGWKYQVWFVARGKTRRDDKEGFFSSPSFPSASSWKASCLTATNSCKGATASFTAALGNVSNSSRGGRKPRDSWGSYLTWVSGEAELPATISFG